jgi:uncharacterized membrane protein
MAIAVGQQARQPDVAARLTATDAAASPSPRYAFVDLLRAWAVILMIEAHVFNALLRSDLQQTTAFAVLTFLNGLVAPAFLFMAGFTFVLSAQRRSTDVHGLGKRLGRLGALLLLAYALHLPFASLVQLFTQVDRAQLVSFLQVDILQAIAVSLLVLVVLMLVLRHPRSLGRATLVLTALVVLVTPIVWRYDFSDSLPLPFATYLNAAQSSPFPLFPWSAYVFAGAFTSQLFLAARSTESTRRLDATMANVFCWGLLLLVLGPVVGSYLDRTYPRSTAWSPSPGSFAVRLGVVLIVLSAVWLWTRRVDRPSRVSGALQIVGRESLLVYFVHLVIIYGWLFHLPWRAQVVGPTLSPLACSLVFVGVAGFTCCVAYGWHQAKARDRRVSRVAGYALAGALSCVLLIHTF